VSGVVRFAEVAAAANYRRAVAADDPADVRKWIRQLRRESGPSLLHIKIRPGSPEKLGRPTVKPHEVKERFMNFLAAANR
jgi:phosphonopyruvate decarboxylase